MKQFSILLLIAIGLSMDAFSLALGYGTLNFQNKENLKISIMVGIFHFFMPLLGLFIGNYIVTILKISPNFIMGVILLFISLEMFIELIKCEKNRLSTSFFGLILFSLSVSLDSFSTGIGLNAITNKYLLSSLIFSIVSFSFTYIGLISGKYASKYLGNYARIVGIILLSIIAIVNLCKI